MELQVYTPSPLRTAALLELLAQYALASGLEGELRLIPLTALPEPFHPVPLLAELANIPSDIPAHWLVLSPTISPHEQVLSLPVRWPQLARKLTLLLTTFSQTTPFAVGEGQCLPAERLLLDSQGTEQARLTDKEVQLLRLLSHSREPVSRASLLQEVWGYREDLDTHTLETHIYRLRQKIERDPAAPAVLLTTAEGYTLARS